MSNLTFNPDLLAFIASLALLGAYHVYLRIQLRRNPHYTIQSVNNTARAAWVENIMANSSKDVLAVQTLRNSTMAATFLASTAVLLIIGVLNVSHSANSQGNVLQALGNSYQPVLTLRTLKEVPLLLDLFGAFFFFSFAIRMYNHVGYLINTGGHPSSPSNPSYVAQLLNRGGCYYSFGMRCYYLSVPFVFWLFGPAFLFAASLALVVVLYHVDRAPDSLGIKMAEEEECGFGVLATSKDRFVAPLATLHDKAA
jgi:uncharacterized membrane protein